LGKKKKKGGKKEVMGICHNLICVQGSQNLEGEITEVYFPITYSWTKSFLHAILYERTTHAHFIRNNIHHTKVSLHNAKGDR